MRIPYARSSMGTDEWLAVTQAFNNNQWVGGNQTTLFEQELAQYQGTLHSLFVNSGSSALLLAFHALKEIYPKRYVIVPGVQFPTLTSSLIKAGYIPYVLDVDRTLSLSAEKLREIDVLHYNKDIAGIAVVHVAGNIGYIDKIAEIARNSNLFLLEDNCDGFGGTYKDQKVGSFGTISVTSFHMAHILSTGQGGAIFTNNDVLYNAVKSYREWGRMPDFDDNGPGIDPLPEDYQQRYTYIRQGFNVTPLELQAAIGRVQLKRIDEFIRKRSSNYHKIAQWATEAELETCYILPNAHPVWFAVPLFSTRRQSLFQKLKEKEIEYRNILAGNITLHPGFSKIPGMRKGLLWESNRVLREGFWISCHPSLTDSELDYIREFFEEL